MNLALPLQSLRLNKCEFGFELYIDLISPKDSLKMGILRYKCSIQNFFIFSFLGRGTILRIVATASLVTPMEELKVGEGTTPAELASFNRGAAGVTIEGDITMDMKGETGKNASVKLKIFDSIIIFGLRIFVFKILLFC